MNNTVKFGFPIAVVLLMFGVFFFDIGSTPTDFEGELVFEEQAPGTYELDMYNSFFNYYNVYAEEGKVVGVEVLNGNQVGASFQTCEEFGECDLIDENAPIDGFVCIGRLYAGDAEVGTYSIRFNVAENMSAAINIREVQAVEENSALLQFVPIFLPLFLFGYVSFLLRSRKKETASSLGEQTDFSSLSDETDTMEQRFIKFRNSSNYDSRITWDEGMLNVAVGGNGSQSLTVGTAFGSLIALAYVYNGATTANWSMAGMAGFAFLVLFILFLTYLRGQQILFVHEEHLEVLYERMNYGTPELHANTPRSDITEIKHYTRWVESTDSEGDTSSYEIHVTGIVLRNPNDDRSLADSKYAIPLVEISSTTQLEAKRMADSLKYLLQIKGQDENESKPALEAEAEAETKENFWDQ